MFPIINCNFASRQLSFIVLTTVLFVAGCGNAAAPRPMSESEPSAAAAKKPDANQEAISKVQDVPIAKLDGSTFKLEDYRGQVLVVDFWATYCGPCVKQAPELSAMYQKYKDRGLMLVGLTSDPKSDQGKVEEFVKKVGINYQIGYDNSWISEAFLKGSEDDTGSPPIPQLFVISRNGKVIEHLIGEQPGRMQYLEKVVNEQLSVAR
ncbi:MAG: TlpA disulfide reductase family protein [Acidobacteriota bacterium]|nr:TlpA disulfide reductase family protein [Acidobacteriota bacterium]